MPSNETSSGFRNTSKESIGRSGVNDLVLLGLQVLQNLIKRYYQLLRWLHGKIALKKLRWSQNNSTYSLRFTNRSPFSLRFRKLCRHKPSMKNRNLLMAKQLTKHQAPTVLWIYPEHPPSSSGCHVLPISVITDNVIVFFDTQLSDLQLKLSRDGKHVWQCDRLISYLSDTVSENLQSTNKAK